jgi:ABC-2 type transport system ATP-binding protein
MINPVVDLRDIYKKFGDVIALDSLDLRINPGEMFAVVGPDGAGKTTLLRILASVLVPDSGSARVLSHDLPGDKRNLKRKIGYLSQGFSLYSDLSVDENLAFFSEIYGVTNYASRREELLAFTRLTPFRTRLAGRLSGGMKKKLALACALIHGPELIILDEPTTGVDPVSRLDFWIILGELLNEGLTIAVATPYLDEAERCSRVGLLDRGRFLTIGPPAEIKSGMRGRLFEITTPRPRQVQRQFSLKVFPGLLEVQTLGDRLYVRLEDGPASVGSISEESSCNGPGPVDRIRSFLGKGGLHPAGIRESIPTLENLFISLIKEEQKR